MPGRNVRGFAATAARSLLVLVAMAALTCMPGMSGMSGMAKSDMSAMSGLATILAATSAHAGTTTDIRVIPGAAGALITGAVVRGERDAYRLAAGAGQTLNVEIISVEENAVFQIYLPGKGGRTLPGAGPMDNATAWKGQLPVAGTYRIVVGGTRGNAEYTLRVDAVE